MERKLVLTSGIVILFTSLFCVALRVEKVQASGTIYIRADGSIDPLTANITTTDNVTYTFTDNNYDSIVVERSNIIVDGAGYMLQGTGSGDGFYWYGINNVTIQNTNIKNFFNAVYLYSSSNSSISGNNVANNGYGIYLFSSSNYNSVSGNNVTASNFYGIMLYSHSNYNSVYGNNVANNGRGIVLYSSSNYNSISLNNIANNDYGIWLYISPINRVFHNNLINNTNHVSSINTVNIWDDGYPSGGNYWSDYTDIDSYKGPHQNETGSDGVWDNPYVIDGSNQDRYPLTKPYGGPACDVDGDRDVDIFDIVRMAEVYDVKYPNPQYDRLCDMDLDGDIDIFDIVAAASHYGESW